MLDPDRHARASALFLRALNAPPEAREDALGAEGDAEVREAARRMLRAHATADGPLDHALVQREASGADASGDATRVGGRVGPWRLEEVIGTGGMGVVYRATRADGAYEREVALKLLHAGPDTAGLAARLRAERQILARLEHPRIARLYDGGVTDDGHARGAPYLVMELVRGEPVTAFADARGLGVRERVALAVAVCEGVAYAHQRLVVHRDLKPSNILVASGDGSGFRVPGSEPLPPGTSSSTRGREKPGEVNGSTEAPEISGETRRERAEELNGASGARGPRDGGQGKPGTRNPPGKAPANPEPRTAEGARVKLLDFGIAKLLDASGEGELTRTQAALTPAYAAPEQVTGGEVTTATDVYALGVLLYELLAGARPYSLSGTTAAEAERVITQTTPPPPSARAPAPRRRALRGDLDVIVLKALEKEPERRYSNAEALGADLRRWMGGLAVEARPATAAYRVGRFVRRHRALAAAGAAVLLALVGGAGLALWQAREARAERRTADRVNAFVTEMLASADPYAGGGRDLTVAAAADAAAARIGELEGEPETEAGVRLALGATYRGLGDYDTAGAHLRRALALREAHYGPRHPETAEALTTLGGLLLDRSEYPEADSLLRLALAVRQRHPGEHRADYAATLSTLGQVAFYQGELETAERQLREAIGLLRAHPEPRPAPVQAALGQARYALGITLHEAGDYAAADSVLTPLVAEMREADRPPATLGSALGILAWNHDYLGNEARIEPLLREALAFRERRFGPDHPETGYALNDLAYYYQFYPGDVERAEAAFLRALAAFRGASGDDVAAVPSVLNNLGSLYRGSGRAPEAVPLLREAVEIQRALLGPDHVDTSYPLINLGRTYVVMGQPARALEPLREALRLRRLSDGDVHRRVGTAQEALATALVAAGRRDEGLALYAEAAATMAAALDPDHVDVAEIEAFHARALADGGDREGARRLLAHALPILRETYPEGNDRRDAAEALSARLGG